MLQDARNRTSRHVGGHTGRRQLLIVVYSRHPDDEVSCVLLSSRSHRGLSQDMHCWLLRYTLATTFSAVTECVWVLVNSALLLPNGLCSSGIDTIVFRIKCCNGIIRSRIRTGQAENLNIMQRSLILIRCY